ncbi:MAG: alanine dehydrogenase [Omnitrophica WOR_2 bacterium RIFCSPHIGHO2_01_FULL_48_9]|nr:MAG: alanine dehydrogenase [Omnitrophica WOR_2 bacterium RIFCSPHIGHO2_02_FULL_48_11]OGX30997.1 MAG: alanine dehydrogenase [Omnitrophica WOR_2 bacterium RIFCSPHIGHO2_01_FULL_48_9]
MIVGIPKEIKNNEYRVGILPVGVESLKKAGHEVLMEKDAGSGSGIRDEKYLAYGAKIVNSSQEIYSQADMIVKIKEPMPQEYALLRPGQIVFTYFHFAASRELTEAMLKQKINAFAYETLQDAQKNLPCLTPMSEVAGRMAVHEGAKYLEEPMKGRGILLGGVPGVAPAEVVILGAGVVGFNACKIAAGMGANVVVLDINLDRLRYIDDVMPPNVHTLMSNAHTIRDSVLKADLVISSVLKRGAKSPCLVDRETVAKMKPGSVVVDVAIDQGGSFETSRPTTHENPTYVLDGVVHYCVTNMPGAVARTSTYALTNATLPYILMLADLGVEKGIRASYELRTALNMLEGQLVMKEVAETFGLPWKEIKI